MERVILGYNDSEAAHAARAWAIEHALAHDAEIILVYVVSSVWQWELAIAQMDTDPLTRELQRHLHGEWSQPLRDAGVPWRSELLVGRPAQAIMECARREGATLIVVGMSTRGTLTELVLGSEAHKLTRQAARPVVAVPAAWKPVSAAA